MLWKKKKLKLLLIMTSCVLLTGAIFPGKLAADTVIEEWVARYNADAYDYVYDIAVDSSGNVYVTGESYGSGQGDDYATIKYSPDGNELWVARYNGPGNSDDRAEAIALDSSGNVYVTGYSTGDGTNKDYATIKYSPDGNELWVARYNGPGNGSDSGRAIALDSSGNVYVAGTSYGSGTGYDCTTVKYAPDGTELWVVSYNGPVNGSDRAKAIAVDSSGNIYVGGDGDGAGQYAYSDYATIKYSQQLADTDNDGLSDGDEEFVYGTDLDNPDTDDDGLLDGTEVDIAEGTGCPNPLDPDSDDDNLLDGDEVAIGTNPCDADTDGDGVPDDVDPLPTDPGVTGGFIEEALRDLSDTVEGFDISVFDAKNDNAREGRRNWFCNKLDKAAKAVAKGDYEGAIRNLTKVLHKVDGEIQPKKDWMVDSDEKNELRAAVEALIVLLELM